jgi:hypothetical protein
MADAPALSSRCMDSIERDNGLAETTIGFRNFNPRYVADKSIDDTPHLLYYFWILSLKKEHQRPPCKFQGGP